MLSLRAAAVVVLIATLIYGINLYTMYNPKIRGSASFWIIGIVCTVAIDLLWVWLVRSLDNNVLIAHYGFAWEIATKLIAVAIPVLIFNVELTGTGYFGVALIICGGLFLKFGGTVL